jgi:phenylpropionate dioxygenase-like ring-hydroxylating dioxygenase large terminal subunit
MWTPLPEFPITPFDIGKGPTLPDEDIMRTGHVDVAAYVDPDRFAEEAELLGRIWLNTADETDVANPGDWIVRDIGSSKTSVLITRDANGVLHAFHNICRHRGMQLVWEESGNSTRFSCPYHAWTYGADGSLKSVPDEEGFPCLERESSGLRPVHIGVWEGFIFINLDPKPAQTLAEFMAPISARFQDLPFTRFTRRATIRERLNGNWKLLLEAQSESYHIRALHARTVSTMLSSRENPFCHPLAWEPLGPHRTWSTGINPAFQLSDNRPVQRFAFSASAQVVATADAAGVADAPPSGFRGADFDESERSPIWAADNMIIFPNCQVNAGANGCWMHRFCPVSENETDWEARYYFTPPKNLRQEFAQHYTVAFNRDTLMEDNSSCSRQQRVLKSGAIEFIQFGMQEMACRHSAAVVKAAVKAPPPLAIAAE